jgi:hypothetical protein
MLLDLSYDNKIIMKRHEEKTRRRTILVLCSQDKEKGVASNRNPKVSPAHLKKKQGHYLSTPEVLCLLSSGTRELCEAAGRASLGSAHWYSHHKL